MFFFKVTLTISAIPSKRTSINEILKKIILNFLVVSSVNVC